MRSDLNILFYLKKPKNYQFGPLPIYLRMTVDQKRCEVALKREIEPEDWDKAKKRAKGTREEARTFNNYIDAISFKIQRIHSQMIANGDEITAEEIKETFLGKNLKPKFLIEIYQDHNDEMESMIGNGFSENTFRTFKSSLKHIKEFVKAKYQMDDIVVKKVDQNFIKNYENHLKTKKNKCTPISADKYIKHLKKIVLRCFWNKWIIDNPFLHYKSTAKPTPKLFLTMEELNIIINKKLPVERLEWVRDIFIFSCYTGLSYIDIQKLKPLEIAIGDDGKKWIFTKRHKTGTPVHLPLLPVPLEIIDKYKDHPVCVIRSLVLPIYTNQRMNSYLKEIADLCGITKWLTFHIARHTFATTITLSNGVPIETVSKMLGHATIKTTQHYAKVLDVKTGLDMAVLEAKLEDIAFVQKQVKSVSIKEPETTAKIVRLMPR